MVSFDRETDMSTEEGRFIKAWVLSFILLAVISAVFICMEDPYLLLGMPRVQGLNASKPAAATHLALMKAYDVFRFRPKTLILGSSRAALGLDDLDLAWPQEHRPIYNLALPAAGSDVAYRYLVHSLSRNSSVSLVVLSVEFEYWIEFVNRGEDELTSHISIESDGRRSANPRQIMLRDFFMATFSLAALHDSFATLTAYVRNDPEDLNAGNWTGAWWVESERFRLVPYYAFARGDLDFLRFFLTKPFTPRPTAAVRAIAELCQERNIHLIVVLSPSHAEESEMLSRLGYSQAIEGWKRGLVALTTQYGAELWDFDDYNFFTTEVVPKVKQPMRWFFDPEHYSHELGHEMLKRIFYSGDPRLGSRLTPQNVESHLQEIRQHQHAFQQEYRREVQTVGQLYEAVVRAEKSSRRAEGP